jgi:two-component system cell cycle sensor histidine kinase PleC
MLNYFKYIAFISFLLAIIAAFFSGQYFRYFAAKAVIEDPIVQNNKILVESYTNNVLCKYSQAISHLNDKNLEDWQKDPFFIKFSKLSSTILSTNSSSQINIYNKHHDKIFSTNSSEVIFHSEQDKNLTPSSNSTALQSQLIPSMGLKDGENKIQKGSFVRTVIYTDNSKCYDKEEENNSQPLKVVIELYENITPAWNNLRFFETLITIGILITFVLLYVALFITSRRTEKLVNRQHEEKTKLEKAKNIAEIQNQQKSMFLANVSHELRTPLNAIIGFSEIIKDEVLGPVGHNQYKEYIADINASGVHLLSLINDILDYSKAEAKKLDVEAIDIDICKIAHNCLRLIEQRANEAKVQLIEDIPKDPVALLADPKRMKQVILNLLSNGVKFTPEGGSVTLSVTKNAKEGIVKLMVFDTGIGIAKEDMPKAMAPFGQIDSSVSRRYEGTGLGLPLTKKLTELMNGTFDIKSEIGIGTSIELIFPISAKKH